MSNNSNDHHHHDEDCRRHRIELDSCQIALLGLIVQRFMAGDSVSTMDQELADEFYEMAPALTEAISGAFNGAAAAEVEWPEVIA
jgi:hypothetical protein